MGIVDANLIMTDSSSLYVTSGSNVYVLGGQIDVTNGDIVVNTGNLTVNSSGGNLVITIIPGVTVQCRCIGTALTTAADWDPEYNEFAAITGSGNVVLNTAKDAFNFIAAYNESFSKTKTSYHTKCDSICFHW